MLCPRPVLCIVRIGKRNEMSFLSQMTLLMGASQRDTTAKLMELPMTKVGAIYATKSIAGHCIITQNKN